MLSCAELLLLVAALAPLASAGPGDLHHGGHSGNNNMGSNMVPDSNFVPDASSFSFGPPRGGSHMSEAVSAATPDLELLMDKDTADELRHMGDTLVTIMGMVSSNGSLTRNNWFCLVLLQVHVRKNV